MAISPHDSGSSTATPTFPLLSSDEAWRRLPPVVKGGGRPLPSWACILADKLPRTTAALLQLDHAQRVDSPVPAAVRAGMRRISAHLNGCASAEVIAAFDAQQAGVEAARWDGLLQQGFPGWSDAERAALHFARGMTLESGSVTDADFAALVEHFGARRAASMVLLMAYANFQDRLLLCLRVPQEPTESAAPLDVAFVPEAFTVATTPPPPQSPPALPALAVASTASDPDWSAISHEEWQQRLEAQRQKPTRLPIPDWPDVASQLPAGFFQQPTDIVWYRMVFGYAPELAVPFERFMRTAGAETNRMWDRVFASSLFWVTTRAVNCPYCMGHCEMNWEVAGLTADDIAARSRLLSSGNWSGFPIAEQQAFAFARKLGSNPGGVSPEDVAQLQRGFGLDRALVIVLNACRHHYMTRISNGFQLTLERENVFFDYYNMPRPAAASK